MRTIRALFSLKAQNRYAAILRPVVPSAGIMLASLSAVPTQAQIVEANLPVLEAQTDANGVEMNFGTFLAASPFEIKAPGAGNLSFKASFNGRKMSFNLNIYITDLTYRNAWDNPNSRDITVHIGGREALFQCSGFGQCSQPINADGSELTRNSGEMYVYTDGDGTIYTFFAPGIEYLPPCNDPDNDPECNASGFYAQAFVSTIKYPQGEKLTFEPYQTSGKDIVRSN